MTREYDLENLLDVSFPFKITKIERDFPNIFVQINDMKIVFRNYEEFNYFGYYLKRQFDLGTIKKKSNEYNIDDLKEYIILDSGFNILGNFSHEEKTQKLLEKNLLLFNHYGEKCFIGILKDEKITLEISDNKSEIMDYSLSPTSFYNKKALVRDNNLLRKDEFFVYVNSSHKPTKLVDIAYLFVRYGNKFMFDYAYKNNWIY